MIRYLLDTNIVIYTIKNRPEGAQDEYLPQGKSEVIAVLTFYKLQKPNKSPNKFQVID